MLQKLRLTRGHAHNHANNHANNNRTYLIGSVIVIGLTVAIDYLVFSPIPAQEQMEKAQAALANSVQHPKKLNSAEGVLLATITLPPPPQSSRALAFQAERQTKPKLPHSEILNHPPKSKGVQMTGSQPQSLAMQNPEAHSNIAQAKAFQNAKTADDASQNLADSSTAVDVNHNSYRDNTKSSQSIPNKKLVDKHYQQLSNLDGHRLQLIFPKNNYATAKILRYMHDCIGVGIGAIAVGADTPKSLTLLTRDTGNYSAIMRLPTGYLSPQEQNLLDAYAPTKRLARLYPKWFDYALSEKIAGQIGAQGLSQLSGIYRLRGSQLWLDELTINEKAIETSWLLSDINICRA